MTKKFNLPAIESVHKVDTAIQLAVDWQNYASESDLSYSELAEYGEYFATLAGKFALTEEFKENGII